MFAATGVMSQACLLAWCPQKASSPPLVRVTSSLAAAPQRSQRAASDAAVVISGDSSVVIALLAQVGYAVPTATTSAPCRAGLAEVRRPGPSATRAHRHGSRTGSPASAAFSSVALGTPLMPAAEAGTRGPR